MASSTHAAPAVLLLMAMLAPVAVWRPSAPPRMRGRAQPSVVDMKAGGREATPGGRATRRVVLASLATVGLSGVAPARAVSGGGKDFSGSDISNQDFSGQDLGGKEFRGTIATRTNFKGAKLTGSSFFNADLEGSDFSGAKLGGASFEKANLAEVSFKDATMTSSYFSESVLDVKDLSNADFSESLMPVKTLVLLCERKDLDGINPASGISTRESLMCP